MSVKELTRRGGRLLGLKMINDPVNNLQIKLLEGPDSLINFALSKKFDEHLSLPRSDHRILGRGQYAAVTRIISAVYPPATEAVVGMRNGVARSAI